MKNKLHTIIGTAAGFLFLVSCGTYNSAYVDDIYYNPKTDSQQKMNLEHMMSDQKAATVIDSSKQNESDEFFLSDYNDNEYSERLKKFHDDEYDGDYYEEDDVQVDYNTSINFGYSPYGTNWGLGFGYGNWHFNSMFYDPWYYDPWYSYNPYYSYWDPWYRPYYGYSSYYNPYYYGNFWYDNHFYWGGGYLGNSNYDISNDRGSHYGKRHSYGHGSPDHYANSEKGSSRKNADSNINSGANNDEWKGDFAPMSVTQGTRKQAGTKSGSGSVNSVNPTRIAGQNASSIEKTEKEAGRDAQIGTANKAKTFNNSSKDPASIARKNEYKSNSSINTRSRSEGKKDIPSNIARSGYTPSYTRTRTSNSRNSFNNGSTYTRTSPASAPSRTATQSRPTKVATSTRTNNVNIPSRSISTPSRSYSKKSISTPNRSSSSYSAPSSSSSRSSSSSYSAPSRSSSSGSSYSAPSRSSNSGSSSTPRSSSGSSRKR